MHHCLSQMNVVGRYQCAISINLSYIHFQERERKLAGN
jgi:hypothetical protein